VATPPPDPDDARQLVIDFVFVVVALAILAALLALIGRP